jgi:hypothetical protein
MDMQMTALKLHRYAGRRLNAGEQFEASRKDARFLSRIGFAEVVPAVASVPVVAVAPVEVALPVFVEQERVEPETDASQDEAPIEIDEYAPRPKRKYTRRDLTAE